jgi:TIR domain
VAEAEVFINYRSGDGDTIADRVADYLSRRFGKEHVFKASQSIPPGAEYRDALMGAVRGCTILLAVMGPEWPHSDLLRDPDDWVRTEILEALAGNKTIVPVLHGRRTEQLRATDLPPELSWLAYRTSRRIDNRTSDADLQQIAQAVIDIIPSLTEVDQPARPPADQGNRQNSANHNRGMVIQGNDVGGDQMNVNGMKGPSQFGQNNTQNNYLTSAKPPAQARLQQIELLRRLEKQFVRPRGFVEAASALAHWRIVILDGPPGVGRTMAAKMLLLQSWSGRGQIHWLPNRRPSEDNLTWVDPDAVGPDDLVWVDLSKAETSVWDDIKLELPTLYARVIKRNARLVVIQPHGKEPPSEFRQSYQEIKSTSAVQVFDHLLRIGGIPRDAGCPLPGFLDFTPAAERIRQFVDYTLDARKQVDGRGSLADWIAIAEERAFPSEAHVTDALAKLSGSSQRALLLATAMLHGAHADVVNRAAIELLNNLDEPADPALMASPLSERLADIGATADPLRHLHFDRRGYEFAVRAFFWRHFPELHDAMASWVRVVIDSADLSDTERTDLVSSFTEQCLERRYQHYWTGLISHLTESPTGQRGTTAASAVLRRGLRDERSAAAFRRQIYDWSHSGQLSIGLAGALVEACAEMADSYPEQAVVRLHHVTRHYPGHDDARATLAGLACSDPWLLRYYLARLGGTGSAKARQADADLFLDISDARLFTTRWPGSKLIAQHQIRGQLAAAWGLAVTHLEYQDWAGAARDWLRCAAEDEANRSVLLDVLVDGASQHAAILAKLFGTAHRAEFRDVISGPLLSKISVAQGLNRS